MKIAVRKVLRRTQRHGIVAQVRVQEDRGSPKLFVNLQHLAAAVSRGVGGGSCVPVIEDQQRAVIGFEVGVVLVGKLNTNVEVATAVSPLLLSFTETSIW